MIERNSTSLSRIDDVTDIDLRPCRPPLLQGETDAEHWRAEVELVLILVLGISEKLIFYIAVEFLLVNISSDLYSARHFSIYENAICDSRSDIIRPDRNLKKSTWLQNNRGRGISHET